MTRMLAVLTASLALGSSSFAQEPAGRVANIAEITADSFRTVTTRHLIKVWTVGDVVVEGTFARADSGKGALFFQKRPEPVLFSNVDVLYASANYKGPYAVVGAAVTAIVAPTLLAILCWGTCGGYTPVNVLIAGSLGGIAGASVGSRVRRWKLRYSRR